MPSNVLTETSQIKIFERTLRAFKLLLFLMNPLRKQNTKTLLVGVKVETNSFRNDAILISVTM